MASSQVSSPIASALLPQVSYANLGRRIAAHLIDIAIALAVFMAASFLMRALRALDVWSVPAPPAGGEADPIALWHGLGAGPKAAVIVCFIVMMGPFYLAFLQSSAWQASIGKRLLNIYLTDTEGRRVSFLRALVRSFAKDFFNVFYIIGLISVGMIAATPKRQGVHDLMASTVVVNGRTAEGGSPEWWRFVAGFGIQILWFLVTFLLVFRAVG